MSSAVVVVQMRVDPFGAVSLAIPNCFRGREPAFGQIKDARGFDRFMQRGIEACRSEWSLTCATHNLLKLWRSGKACWN